MEKITSRFLELEDDYIECKKAINNSINQLSQHNDSSAGQLAQSNLIEAQRYLKMMTVEIRGKDPASRKAMQAKINLYREEVQAMQRDYERAMLMSKQTNASKSFTNSSASHRDRIIKTTDRMKKSSRTLEDSQRLVAQTEEIGISVLDNLAQQRESLLASTEKVKETNEMSNDARRILKRMSRKILTNKVVLWMVICMLCVSIGLVIYYDFLKRY